MKLSKNNSIYLEDFRARGSKIFTGRDRGKNVREASRIDEIELNYDEVVIVIPDNIYSINPSFFEELFINDIEKLGKEGFLQKFKFISEGNYKFEKPLNEAIDRVSRYKTAID